jgi:hypothetical protein
MILHVWSKAICGGISTLCLLPMLQKPTHEEGLPSHPIILPVVEPHIVIRGAHGGLTFDNLQLNQLKLNPKL